MTGSVTGFRALGGPGRPLEILPAEQAGILFVLRCDSAVRFVLQEIQDFPPEDYEMEIETQFCQKGEVGKPILVQIVDQDGNPVDLSDCSGLKITLTPPDLSTGLVRTATLLTDGLDGILVYNTVSADVANVGSVRVQGQGTKPSGALKLSRLGTLKVLPNGADL